MKTQRIKRGKCIRKRRKKKEERGKKMRKEDVNGSNKCKIRKNYGKKAKMGVEKRRVARGKKNVIFRGGGE
jgi:hypothetical protein